VHTLQIQTRYWRGDLAGAEEHFADGLKFFDDPGFRQLPASIVVAYGLAAFNAWVFGRADIARERMAQMMTAANESNPFIMAFSTSFGAILQILLREYEQAEALAAKGLELSEKNQIPVIAALCRCALGRARAQLGCPTEGIALISQGIAGLLEVGTHVGDTAFTTWLAEAQARDGAIAGALRTVEEALRANPGAVVSKPDALRLRGELRLKRGQPQLAETDFNDAIALAQKIGAKALELRTTMSLARLLDQQGKRNDAHAKLAEIYGWFTEGFDTADLKDAKALLDERGGLINALREM